MEPDTRSEFTFGSILSEWQQGHNAAEAVYEVKVERLESRLAEAERLLRELLAKLPDRRPETDVEEDVAVFAAAAREFLEGGA